MKCTTEKSDVRAFPGVLNDYLCGSAASLWLHSVQGKTTNLREGHFNSFHNLYEPAGEIPVDYLDDKNELVC